MPNFSWILKSVFVVLLALALLSGCQCSRDSEKVHKIAVIPKGTTHVFWVVYKKRMLFCIFSCTNSVRQFILSAWLLKLLIVGTVEVKISLNLARRPTINSATAAMIVVNKAAKTPQ